MTRRPKGPVGDPPPNLRQRQRADGSWRVWWEATGPLRKLGFTSVELDADAPLKAAREARRLNAAVDEARLTGTAPRSKRGPVCIEDVVEDYKRGIHYLESLAPKTRDSYAKGLRLIIAKWGDVPVTDFTKPMARTWYESLYRDAGKWQAPALIRLLSIIMNHAELRGWRAENSNPCMRLGVSIPRGRARVVTWPEYDALQAAAVKAGLPSIGLAMALSYLAGQRETDVMMALRGDFARQPVRWPVRPISSSTSKACPAPRRCAQSSISANWASESTRNQTRKAASADSRADSPSRSASASTWLAMMMRLAPAATPMRA